MKNLNNEDELYMLLNLNFKKIDSEEKSEIKIIEDDKKLNEEIIKTKKEIAKNY